MRTLSTVVLCAGLAGCRARSERAHAAVAAPVTVKAVDGHCPGPLADTREGGLDPDRYVVPTAAEYRTMRDAVVDLAKGARDEARSALATIGFQLVDLEGDLVLVREGARRRGGGAYVFRAGAASRSIVQAPHTFFDEGTLPLACELFARGNAAALFINTAHRYKSASKTPSGVFPADVAHARDSLFQAATEGMLRARAAQKPVVVQLHGFGEREAEGAVVLSGGVRRFGLANVAAAQAALARVIDGGVLRFPDDQNDLGATTNVQGALVREAGGQFLHIEMGAPLRRALLSNPIYRASVLATLADAMEGA